MSAAAVIEEHRRAGREFTAAGVRSFVREHGEGEPVVCLHGVPTSSFLYRKVLRELAARGLRGIAWDLPGLGPDRIASLTLLNTIVEVDRFKRPWSMEPFARRGVGELYLRALTKPAFRALMRVQGIGDMRAVSGDELDAYVDLLRRDDGGTAFLRIMRGFERTPAKRALYASALRDVPYPVRVVWGEHDPALKLGVHGEQARRAAGLDAIHRVPGKHFLQEDQASASAERIGQLVATTAARPISSARVPPGSRRRSS